MVDSKIQLKTQLFVAYVFVFLCTVVVYVVIVNRHFCRSLLIASIQGQCKIPMILFILLSSVSALYDTKCAFSR